MQNKSHTLLLISSFFTTERKFERGRLQGKVYKVNQRKLKTGKLKPAPYAEEGFFK